MADIFYRAKTKSALNTVIALLQVLDDSQELNPLGVDTRIIPSFAVLKAQIEEVEKRIIDIKED